MFDQYLMVSAFNFIHNHYFKVQKNILHLIFFKAYLNGDYFHNTGQICLYQLPKYWTMMDCVSIIVYSGFTLGKPHL